MRDNFQYKISSQEMAKASLAELVRRLLRVEGVSQTRGLPAAGRHCVAGRQKVCRKREKAWLDLAPAGRSMSWWQRQRPAPTRQKRRILLPNGQAPRPQSKVHSLEIPVCKIKKLLRQKATS
jgi:hypothetical protein